jgi:thiamine phosphate synthase YjbQ (UPF0047 family)
VPCKCDAHYCIGVPVTSFRTGINDDEYGLHQDYEKWLEGLAPHAPIRQYRHNDTGEDACPERSDRNADAHMKRQIMGREAVVAVTNGRLDFGTWERILGVSWIADTGVSTAAGGSGC